MTVELFTACRISSCKIPKLESEAIVRRRTNNAMVKLKGNAKVQWNLIRHAYPTSCEKLHSHQYRQGVTVISKKIVKDYYIKTAISVSRF
jgi:hypothetical protein